ncbi:AsmA family protein [Variovorax sp. Sphag1AA]|uniref:AsmA family protein n=1 Tax=Variovorax sp. Sphag1AA TaxID=2587027 RepID=UPI00160B3DEE|nr:AsmA family protein [Variovorax sp. Sphag1AA]MBB3177552.1 AsmA protein [Variovorax sp. Sphag1AA]
MADTTSVTVPKRSGRGWRIAGIVLAVIVVLLVAAAIGLRMAFPPARISALLAEQVTAATGRAFRIDGDLSIRLLPTIAVRADNVALANAEWGSQPDMFRFKRAAFDVSLRDLLDRRIRILSIEVDGADVLLETDGAGRYNWQMGPRAPSTGKTAAPALALDRLLLTQVHIGYRNAGKGTSNEIDIESLDLEGQGDRDRLSATFKLGSQQWTAEGDVGRPATLLSGTDEWPFNLRFATGGALMTAKGGMGVGPRTGMLSSQLTVRADNAQALSQLSKVVAALPMPVEASADVQRNGDEWRFDALKLSLAGQHLNGKVTWMATQPTPSVDVDLSSAEIDLGKWGVGRSASKPAPAESGSRKPLFGDAPLITFEALPAFPLRVTLGVDRLTVPGLPLLSGVKARAVSDKGRLTIEPVSFGVAGGDVKGSLAIALSKGTAPRTEVQLTARSLSVDALDGMWGGGKQFKGGRASLAAKLSMTGRTPRSLAASSNGDVQFSVRDVALTGRAATIDRDVVARLVDVLLPKQASRDDLVVQCAVARLPLRNGVAPIDRSIAMETRQIAVAAIGQIDLAKQTIELEFRPRVKKGLDLNPGSLVQLMLLKGPLESPELSIDPKGTVRQAATYGVAAATGGLSLLAPALLGEAGVATGCGLEGGASKGGKASQPEGRKFRLLRPFESIR